MSATLIQAEIFIEKTQKAKAKTEKEKLINGLHQHEKRKKKNFFSRGNMVKKMNK